jgi:hypothetical protein
VLLFEVIGRVAVLTKHSAACLSTDKVVSGMMRLVGVIKLVTAKH